MKAKARIILVQLGSPAELTNSSIRKFLREFLSDPRVIDPPSPLLWKTILECFILPFRPAKIKAGYAQIWDGKTFPLIKITSEFAAAVDESLPENIAASEVFLLSSPRFAALLDEWQADNTLSHEKWVIIPQFPQYAEATTASVMDQWGKALIGRAKFPAFEFINHFHLSRAFIDESVVLINENLSQWTQEGHQLDVLIMSFHGLPKDRILEKNDPYYRECYETFFLISQQLEKSGGPVPPKILMTFQSRFGAKEWLTPSTEESILKLLGEGLKNIAVYCPSFVVDCLETSVEIGVELQELAVERQGQLFVVPCLNTRPQWIKKFSHFAEVTATGSASEREELFYTVDEKEIIMSMPEQNYTVAPLSARTKKILKIVFFTLFLDLVGFSIIFPMFPALAKYYLAVDSENYFLRLIIDNINGLLTISGGTAPIVLFGGVLGALYSLLQFLCAPFWGGLSDRIGRRPILQFTMIGLGLSYFIWGFAGTFTTLIIARFLGGIMSGNISTATAVVADITDSKNRSKGMAIIGIAFALGFILGPALGGILSTINLLDYFPEAASFGVNPFSVPAFFAAILSFMNVILISFYFPETLPAKTSEQIEKQVGIFRSANILKLFAPVNYPGVNLTNMSYFFFLLAFSGMEFTLTFLAVERLGFSSLDNAYMFIFIGFVIAFVQGGVVRRKAATVGERKMSLMGLATIIPGLFLVAYCQSLGVLYLGLFFLAAGSAMTIPCLTTLVSLYTPEDEQGKVIGIFRSLGALARVIGPLAACLIYWKYGSRWPYQIGAIFLLLPLYIIYRLPQPSEKK